MKKTYLKPLMEVTEMELQASIAAASGPGGGDALAPGITDDGDDGPGGGDHGGTPNRSKYNQFDQWEDEE